MLLSDPCYRGARRIRLFHHAYVGGDSSVICPLWEMALPQALNIQSTLNTQLFDIG